VLGSARWPRLGLCDKRVQRQPGVATAATRSDRQFLGSFIVRGLEPSVRVAPDGTVYVSSIRACPAVRRASLLRHGGRPPGVGSTYPFQV